MHHRVVAHPQPLVAGLFLVLAVVGPLIVATSRVYRGMHNPTDVICGLLIGAGCIAVGYVAVRSGAGRARTDGRLERDPTATPRSFRLVQEGIR